MPARMPLRVPRGLGGWAIPLQGRARPTRPSDAVSFASSLAQPPETVEDLADVAHEAGHVVLHRGTPRPERGEALQAREQEATAWAVRELERLGRSSPCSQRV
jgi:hypothetical protein